MYLPVYRKHAASESEAERDAARAETAAAREDAAAIAAQLAEARQAHDTVQADLAAERQAHAATQARLEAGRTELDASRRQLEALRSQFSTELERAREAVTLAQERAEASERRSLRELDQERTARQKSERTAEDLRGELAAARSEARDAAVARAEGRAKLEAQAAALVDRLAVAEQAQRKAAGDLDAVQAELAAAQRRAERGERKPRSRASCWPPCASRRANATGGGGARPEVRRRPRRKTKGKSRATSRGRRRCLTIRTMATTAVTAAMTAITERADAIRWIQAQMDDYGLTLDDLDAAGVLQAAAASTPTAAGGLLSQRGRADLGRAGRDAVVAQAGGQCGAERGVFPGWIALPVIPTSIAGGRPCDSGSPISWHAPLSGRKVVIYRMRVRLAA